MPHSYTSSSPLSILPSFLPKRFKNLVHSILGCCTLIFLFLFCNAIITLLRPVAPDLCIEFQEHCTFTPVPVDIAIHSSSSSSSSPSSPFDPRLLKEFSLLYLQSSIDHTLTELPFPRLNNTYTNPSILYDHPLTRNTLPRKKQGLSTPFQRKQENDNGEEDTTATDNDEDTAHIVLYIHGHHGHPTQASALATLLHAKMNSMVNYPHIELFATDFQSTSSAFHRGLIQAQAYYVNSALLSIRKHLLGEETTEISGERIIRKRYRNIGKVIIIAHSMGNVAARASFLAVNYLPGSINMIISLNGPSIAHPYSVDYDYITLFSRMAQLWTSTVNNAPSSSSLTPSIDSIVDRKEETNVYPTHAKVLDDLVYISISGGGGDSTIRPELTIINNILPSTHGFSIHTMNIPGVWLHTSHDGIVNCGQFTAKLVDILIIETLPIQEIILTESLTVSSHYNEEESKTHQRTERLRYVLTDYMFQTFFQSSDGEDDLSVIPSPFSSNGKSTDTSADTLDYLLDFPVVDNNYVNVGPNAELLINFSTLEPTVIPTSSVGDTSVIENSETSTVVTPIGCLSVSRMMNNPSDQQGLSILTNIPLYRDLQIYVRVRSKEVEGEEVINAEEENTGCRIHDYTFPCQKGTIVKSTSLPYWNVRSHLHGSWDGIPLSTLEKIGIDFKNKDASSPSLSSSSLKSSSSANIWSTIGHSLLLIPIYIHGYFIGLLQHLGLSVQDPLFPYTSLRTTYPYQPVYTSSSSSSVPLLRQGYDWTQGIAIDTMVPRHVHNHDPYGSIAITSVGTLHLYSLNIDTKLLYNDDPAIDICLVTEIKNYYYNPQQYSYSYQHMNQEEKNHEESVFSMVQLDSPSNHELFTDIDIFKEPIYIPEGHSLSLRYIINQPLSPYAMYRILVQRRACRTVNKNSNTTEYELFLPVLHYSVMQKNESTNTFRMQTNFESFMIQPSAGSWLYNDQYFQYHKKISTSTFHHTEISEEFTASEIAEIQYSFTTHMGFADGPISLLSDQHLYPVLTFISDTQCAYTLRVYEDWTGSFGQWIHHHTGWSVTALISIVLFIISAQLRKLENAQRKYFSNPKYTDRTITSNDNMGTTTTDSLVSPSSLSTGSRPTVIITNHLLHDYIPKYISIRTAFIDNYLWLCVIFIIQAVGLPALSIHSYLIPRILGTSTMYMESLNIYPSIHDILQAFFFALSGACTILYLGPKLLYGIVRCFKYSKFPEMCRLCCYRNSTMIVSKPSNPYSYTVNGSTSNPIIPKFISRPTSSTNTPTTSAPGTPNRYFAPVESSSTATGIITNGINSSSSTLRRKILSGTNITGSSTNNLTNDLRSNSFTVTTVGSNTTSMSTTQITTLPSGNTNLGTVGGSSSFLPRNLDQFSSFGTNNEANNTNDDEALTMDKPPSIERSTNRSIKTVFPGTSSMLTAKPSTLYSVGERATSPSGRRKRKTSSWAEEDLDAFLAEHGNPNAFYHHSTTTPSPQIYHSPLESPAPPPLFSISPPIRLNRLESIEEVSYSQSNSTMNSPARKVGPHQSLVSKTEEDGNSSALLPSDTSTKDQYTKPNNNNYNSNEELSLTEDSSLFSVPRFIRNYNPDQLPLIPPSPFEDNASPPPPLSSTVLPSNTTTLPSVSIDSSPPPSITDYRIISIPRLIYAVFRFCLFGDPIQTHAYSRVLSTSSPSGTTDSSSLLPNISINMVPTTNNLSSALNIPSSVYSRALWFFCRYSDIRIFLHTQWTLFRRWIAVCYTWITVYLHHCTNPLVRTLERCFVRMKASVLISRYKGYIKPCYTLWCCLFCTLPRLPIRYTVKLVMYGTLVFASYFLPWLSVLGAYITLLIVTFINYLKYTGVLPIYVQKMEVSPLSRMGIGDTTGINSPPLVNTNYNDGTNGTNTNSSVSPLPSTSRTVNARLLLNSLLHYQVTILLLYSALIGIKAMSVIYSIEVISLWYHKYIWLHPFHRDIGVTVPMTLHLLSALYHVPMGSMVLLPEQIYSIMLQLPALVRYKIRTTLLLPSLSSSSSSPSLSTLPSSIQPTGFSTSPEYHDSLVDLLIHGNSSGTIISSFVYPSPTSLYTKGLYQCARILSWLIAIPLHTIIAVLAWSIFAVSYQELYRIIYYISFIAIIMVSNIGINRLLHYVYIPVVPSNLKNTREKEYNNNSNNNNTSGAAIASFNNTEEFPAV